MKKYLGEDFKFKDDFETINSRKISSSSFLSINQIVFENIDQKEDLFQKVNFDWNIKLQDNSLIFSNNLNDLTYKC